MPNEQCHFTRLPIELRQQIYQYLLVRRRPLILRAIQRDAEITHNITLGQAYYRMTEKRAVRSPSGRTLYRPYESSKPGGEEHQLTARGNSIAIIYVSKQINWEALDVLYGHNTIRLCNWEPFGPLWSDLSDATRSRVRHLVLTCTHTPELKQIVFGAICENFSKLNKVTLAFVHWSSHHDQKTDQWLTAIRPQLEALRQSLPPRAIVQAYAWGIDFPFTPTTAKTPQEETCDLVEEFFKDNFVRLSPEDALPLLSTRRLPADFQKYPSFYIPEYRSMHYLQQHGFDFREAYATPRNLS